MSVNSWETTPRMLQELCDGHPGYSVEVYALDLPNDVRLWLCKSCWVRVWRTYGRPEQPAGALSTRARLADEGGSRMSAPTQQRTAPLPVEVVEREGSICLTVGGRPAAAAWGPAVDDPDAWFWWNGRSDPYRICGGRDGAAGLLDDERLKWERREASLYHPDHGPLVDEWWMAKGPPGAACVSCGDSIADHRHVATVVLSERGETTRHYVCANCEIWLDDDGGDDHPTVGG